MYYRPDAGSHTSTGAPPQSVRDRQWLGRFSTSTEIEFQAPVTGFQPKVRPTIVQRGLNVTTFYIGATSLLIIVGVGGPR